MGGGFVAGWGSDIVRSVGTIVYVYMGFYRMNCIKGMLSACVCVRVCVCMYVFMYLCLCA